MLIKEIKENAELLWQGINEDLDFYKEIQLPVYHLTNWEYGKLTRSEFNKLRPQFKKLDDKFNVSIMGQYNRISTQYDHVNSNAIIINTLRHKIALLGLLDEKKFNKEVVIFKAYENPQSAIKKVGAVSKNTPKSLTKIFIVHGHDNTVKLDVARFIERLGFEAIILHEQVSGGSTIIEKLENHTDVDFAIVLYTPDDVGKSKDATDLQSRARQNVVFEHGYLIGKLGRKNVCALVKGNVETQSDISGVVYISYADHDGWKTTVVKELKAAGYAADMNKI